MKIAVAGGTGVVGRYAVTAAQEAGHEAVVMSRSAGLDLQSDPGVAAALQGVDVIIDASNAATTSAGKACAFFTDVTRRLHRLGAAAGVSHLVTLSIVGIERVPGFGYYEAKVAQEAATRAGELPATIVRATQFHEFAAQILGRMRLGPVAVVPRMRVRSVAARTVGQILVEMATATPTDTVVEVGGPDTADLIVLARATVKRQQRRIVAVPLLVPGRAGHAMRADALLPGPGARFEGPTFDTWLKTEDAMVVRI
jgi:uncharacterized protein YbjT (DUF2867 family)